MSRRTLTKDPIAADTGVHYLSSMEEEYFAMREGRRQALAESLKERDRQLQAEAIADALLRKMNIRRG